MKTIKQQFKSVALVLSLLILLQGCTAYKSANVTLKSASESESKVLVQTKGGQNLRFKKVIDDNGIFYGIKKRKGKIDEILLNKEFIERIRLKDEVLSTVLTVAFPVGIVVVMVLIFQDSFKWKDSESTWTL